MRYFRPVVLAVFFSTAMDYGKCKVPKEVQLARGNGRPCQPCVQLSHIIRIYILSNCSYLYRLLNYPKKGCRINCSISQSFPGLLDAQLLKSSYWILSLLTNRWGVLKDVQQLGVSLASRNLSAIQKAGVLEVSVVSQRIQQASRQLEEGKWLEIAPCCLVHIKLATALGNMGLTVWNMRALPCLASFQMWTSRIICYKS